MSAVPLSPVLQIVVELNSLPVIKFSSEFLAFPQIHVVRDLVALQFQCQSWQPVGNVTVSVHLMVDQLVLFALGLQKLLEGYFVKRASQENEHSGWTVLNDSRVEHKAFDSKGKYQVIVKVGNT